LWTGALDAAPGTIAQVRTASFDLVRYAKASGAALLLVGHVTKDGQIAGPKAVEHLVDAVLYFEGERGHHFRVLRAVKNRFGATDEIGVFEMTGKGLAEVANPSALFLGDRKSASPGTAVFAGLEGTRPLLCEIQALVSPTAYGTPRRAVVGWDTGRLAMILAVLDARAGVGIGASDVYLNVAGGLKISEPAADLAAAAALVSSFGGEPLPRDCVFFGEISLSGDIRPVPQADARLKEAAKLGFKTAFVPAGTKAHGDAGLSLTEITSVVDLLRFAPEPTPSKTMGRAKLES
jgi:DNA repair protein RadA/Sms